MVQLAGFGVFAIIVIMKKGKLNFKGKQFPVFVEKDEDGFYIVECPIFDGCFTQGRTIDAALKNIKEVIELCLEEKENKEIARAYDSNEVSLHSVSL
jgi:predicted RNase H-like HicB family nuclease